MKRTLIIGDVHGRRTWKSLVQEQEYDLVVFVGDYFDPYDNISRADLISNFKEIIEFKRSQPEKVILLFGNHDLHYLGYTDTWSRYDRRIQPEVEELIVPLIDSKEIQLFHYDDESKVLYSHAGLSYYWYDIFVLRSKKQFIGTKCFRELYEKAETSYEWKMPEDQLKQMVLELNTKFWEKDRDFMRTLGFVSLDRFDIYGTHPTNSPLWIRPDGLIETKLVTIDVEGEHTEVSQVVGHTQLSRVAFEYNIIFVDALGSGYGTLIKDGEVFSICGSEAMLLGKLKHTEKEEEKKNE